MLPLIVAAAGVLGIALDFMYPGMPWFGGVARRRLAALPPCRLAALPFTVRGGDGSGA